MSAESSTTDGWLFKSSSNKKPSDSQTTENNASQSQKNDATLPATVTVAKDAECYAMNHKRRGVALIFNHMYCLNMKPRFGTEKDCESIEKALKKYNFDVRVHNEPTLQNIKDVIKTTSEEDHSDADCLVVIVMTHGDNGYLYASNCQYQPDVLWNKLKSCKTLIGKPKLFFIQACRGEFVDKGIKVRVEVDSTERSYVIPEMADILVMYSSYQGYFSWRSPDTGSWFIQSLSTILNDYKGRNRDLLALLTFVNRRVALEYQSNVPQDEEMDGKKQVCTIVSMLTRLVYFN